MEFGVFTAVRDYIVHFRIVTVFTGAYQCFRRNYLEAGGNKFQTVRSHLQDCMVSHLRRLLSEVIPSPMNKKCGIRFRKFTVMKV
jgi:hypothetical protein